MRLLELTEFIVDCPHSTAIDEGEGIALIRTPNIGAGFFILDNVHRVSESVYEERIKRAKPQRHDLVYAREAPAGNVAIIKDEKLCLGQRTVLIRPDSKKVNPYYLMYYLLSDSKRNQLLSKANGSTVSHVNMKEIRELNVDDILPFNIQQKIAPVLIAYDSQIENNKKRIRLLEEMVDNLYKEWFVRFRFPGYETSEFEGGIPKGWVYDSLDKNQYCSLLPSGIQEFEGEKVYLATADVDGMRVVNHETKITLENRPSRANMQPVMNSVWFAKMKDSRKLLLVDKHRKDLIENTILSTGFTGLKVDSSALYFVFCFLLSKQFDDTKNMYANGSTQQAINNDRIRRIKLLIPEHKIVRQFNDIVHSVFYQINSLEQQNTVLTHQRDLLLPRLMSGKLSI